jgi:hypothetical protein
VHRQIPVTTAERTLADVCGLVGYSSLRRTAADLMRRKLLNTPTLVRTYAQLPVSGRRRRRPLTTLLEELVPGFDPCESDAELDVMDVVRRAGRPLPVPQHRVNVEGRSYRLDFAWPALREALEWQSAAYHQNVAAFHDDLKRQRRLQRAGWRVWPLTSETTRSELLAIVDHIAVAGIAGPAVVASAS